MLELRPRFVHRRRPLHPQVGLLYVGRVHEKTVSGEIVMAGLRRTIALSTDEFETGWSWCPPGGFADRLVRDPVRLRALLARDHVTALRLLIDEASHPMTEEEVHGWLVGRGLLEAGDWSTWWARTRTGLPESAGLLFQDRHVAVPDDDLAGDAPALPSARCSNDRTRSEAERLGDLQDALDRKDGDRARQLLRHLPSIPEETLEALTTLGLRGDHSLLAVLLTAGDTAVITAVSEAADQRTPRATIERATRGVPALQRGDVALALLEAALQQSGGESAALWIGDVLMESLPHADALQAHPRAARWLEARAGEMTVQHTPPPRDRPLRALGRVPTRRLLKLALDLARTLAERHAEGNPVASRACDWPQMVRCFSVLRTTGPPTTTSGTPDACCVNSPSGAVPTRPASTMKPSWRTSPRSPRFFSRHGSPS